jgi:putative polyhydroxyalkanoate system protein
MPDINISRTHDLGLAKARKVAYQWAEKAENDLGMSCEYEESKTGDLVSFTRSGVEGTLKVSPTSFDLNAKLGFLLGAFKGKIESEIQKNLDELLAKQSKPAPKKK